MKNLQLLEKEPLWLKVCELSRLLLKIDKEADSSINHVDLSQLKEFGRSILLLISRALIAGRSATQEEYFAESLQSARNLDSLLNRLQQALLQDSNFRERLALTQNLILAIITADQLREMLFNAQSELDNLRAS